MKQEIEHHGKWVVTMNLCNEAEKKRVKLEKSLHLPNTKNKPFSCDTPPLHLWLFRVIPTQRTCLYNKHMYTHTHMSCFYLHGSLQSNALSMCSTKKAFCTVQSEALNLVCLFNHKIRTQGSCQ